MSSPSSDSFDSEERLLHAGDEKHGNGYLPIGPHASKGRFERISIGWIVAVFSFVLNIGLLVQSTYLGACSSYSRFGSFETGYSTDMEPAKEALEVVRMPFTGELKFDENDTMYRENPKPLYFGEPNAEMDENWRKLMYSAGMNLEEDEVTETGLKDNTWEEPQGGLWRTGLDVFHQLHCLNMVRKSFNPDYYEDMEDPNIDDPPRLRNMHRDHCLDYIRQALMCSADITPVRLQWDRKHHVLIPKFDQLHTCRNFELLHSWSRARALEKHWEESHELIQKMKEEGSL